MENRDDVSVKRRRCRACGREIAPSIARTAEGRDYTYCFCNAGCEQRWMQQKHDPRHVNRSE